MVGSIPQCCGHHLAAAPLSHTSAATYLQPGSPLFQQRHATCCDQWSLTTPSFNRLAARAVGCWLLAAVLQQIAVGYDNTFLGMSRCCVTDAAICCPSSCLPGGNFLRSLLQVAALTPLVTATYHPIHRHIACSSTVLSIPF